jgi:hypothetical protein
MINKFASLDKNTAHQVKVADGVINNAQGIGEVMIQIQAINKSDKTQKTLNVLLKQVLFVPEFERNLLLVSGLINSGHSVVHFKHRGKIFLKGNKDYIELKEERKLFVLHEVSAIKVKLEKTSPTFTSFPTPKSPVTTFAQNSKPSSSPTLITTQTSENNSQPKSNLMKASTLILTHI